MSANGWSWSRTRPAPRGKDASRSCCEGNPSIHYHVWEQDDLAELLVDVRGAGLPFTIEAIVLNRALVESICVLRKG